VKLAGGIVVLLFLMAVFLAVLITYRARSWPDCVSHLMIVKDAAGSSLECVCFDGALSTCFDPGP
jgi:hypothetical protein